MNGDRIVLRELSDDIKAVRDAEPAKGCELCQVLKSVVIRMARLIEAGVRWDRLNFYLLVAVLAILAWGGGNKGLVDLVILLGSKMAGL